MIKEEIPCSKCGAKEAWLIPQYDRDVLVYDCCDAEVPLTPALYFCEFGKYKGYSLDEVNDEWYLNFLLKLAVEKEDWVLQKCITIKLKK